MRSPDPVAAARRALCLLPLLSALGLGACPTDEGGGRTPSAITVIAAGNNQTAQISSPVPVDPSVLIEDNNGPIPGIDVTFAVTGGGGTIQGSSTVTTNSNGVAQVEAWVLGPNPGPNSLSATVSPLEPATIDAVGVAAGTSLTVLTGNGQSGFAGNFSTVLPTVLFTNGVAGVPGALVEFVVTQGGGSVKAATAVTDAAGIANPTAWRLGPAGAQQITVSIPANPAVTPVTIGATANAVPASQYNIVIEYVGATPSPTQQAAFTAAATRWSQLIVGDIPDVGSIPAATAAQCGADTPARVNIDDLHIFAAVQAIDGPGGILGQAGPCFIRQSGSATPFLPISGVMVFDVADANMLETNGLFDETVLHEMGHVLGFGTLWGEPGPGAAGFDLIRPAPCSVEGYYDGLFARQPFLAAATTGVYPRPIVPIEDDQTLQCPGGTRDGHWKEESPTLDDELMTGFIEGPATPMPLSAFTVGSMRDMGYVVNDALADAFSFVPPATILASRLLEPLNLELRNDRLFASAELDQTGRVTRRY